MSEFTLQEHPQPAGKQKKRLGTLKESMLKGSPFPKLHAKAAETRSMLRPVAAALEHFSDQDVAQEPLLRSMIKALELSYSIDDLLDQITGFKGTEPQGLKLASLVQALNMETTRLCHHFHKQGLFLFNFVPKNHYLYHLAELGKHMSPKLAWCYQGEDLMHKVKVLAQGSFRGTAPRYLGNKVLGKYIIGLSHALSA